MTPNDILNKRFEKGMSGYRVEEVHAFLSQVSDYVSGLEREHDDLQRKIEVLAEKLEEYKEDEESLRAALIGAQKLGDSVVRESKRKAEQILNDATHKAKELAMDAQLKLDSEAFELEKLRTEVSSFKANLIKLYQSHLKMIDAIPDNENKNENDIEPPRSKYTPPAETVVRFGATDRAKEEEPEETASQVQALETATVDEDTTSGNTFEFSKPVMETVGAPAEEAPPKRGTRLRYDKIDQFFGEENPIQRD